MMLCSECGMIMAKIKTGILRPMNPPAIQYEYWCGNDHESKLVWEWDRAVSPRNEWHRVNQPEGGLQLKPGFYERLHHAPQS